MSETTTKSFAEQIAEKKKKKKLLISILSLSFIFLISLTIILLAVINVDLRPSVITNPSSIYFNGQSTVQYDKNDSEYEEFMKEYNKAFNSSYLTSIFSGRLGGYEIIEEHLTTLPEEVKNENYVTFLYKSEEDYITLTKSDGKTYYSKYNSNYSIDFYEVTFKLSSEDKIEDMTMYLKYNWNTSNSGTGKNYYAELKLKGNTFKLNEIYENI